MIILVLAIIGGVLYRLGGTSAGSKWRDAGVSLVSVGYLAVRLPLIDGWAVGALIASFGLMWMALSTYRYFLPKPVDYKWWHYALHGFMVALAVLPVALVTKHLLFFAIRCIICSMLVGGWSHLISEDNLEEFGRGFIIVSTLPILFW